MVSSDVYSVQSLQSSLLNHCCPLRCLIAVYTVRGVEQFNLVRPSLIFLASYYYKANYTAMLVRTFLFLSIPSVLQLASAQTCYFPDGTVSADVPCGSGSGPTHCCDSGSVCLDNGLCMSTEYQPFTLSRASCTDRTWTSSKCPIYCLQGETCQNRIRWLLLNQSV